MTGNNKKEMSPPSKINIIPLGRDCNVAEMLRTLGWRQCALPFDWVYSSIDSLRACFQDNFKLFHTGLKLNKKRNGLMDHYGFIYVHDYPSPADMICSDFHIGEGMLWEYNPVGSDWESHYPLVKSKYDRRVDRFLSMMKSPNPILIFSEFGVKNAKILRQVLTDVYKKTNVLIINSTRETDHEKNAPHNIIHGYFGSDPQKWKQAVEENIGILTA